MHLQLALALLSCLPCCLLQQAAAEVFPPPTSDIFSPSSYHLKQESTGDSGEVWQLQLPDASELQVYNVDGGPTTAQWGTFSSSTDSDDEPVLTLTMNCCIFGNEGKFTSTLFEVPSSLGETVVAFSVWQKWDITLPNSIYFELFFEDEEKVTQGHLVTKWDSNKLRAYEGGGGFFSDLTELDVTNNDIGVAVPFVQSNTWHQLTITLDNSKSVEQISFMVDDQLIASISSPQIWFRVAGLALQGWTNGSISSWKGITLQLAPPPPPPGPAPECIQGDQDGDGAVNVLDVVILVNLILDATCSSSSG